MSLQLLSNDPKGLVLVLAETLAGAALPLSAGPFKVDVQDPQNTVTVTAGSDDQTTPTKFVPNGSGAVGTVTVTVTDLKFNLVGTASFDVVAPAPPPQVPDTLNVSFAPAP